MCGLISTKISIAMLCGFQPLLASRFQVNNLQRVDRAEVYLKQVVRQDPPWRLLRWRLVWGGRRDHGGGIDHVGVSLREKVCFFTTKPFVENLFIFIPDSYRIIIKS